MKKLLTLLTLAVAFAVSSAQDYGYLTLVKADQSTVSLSASGLVIRFQNGNLVATQDGQTTTLALTDLKSMQFTTGTTAVQTLRHDVAGGLSVFSTSGLLLGTFADLAAMRSSMPSGIYLINQHGTFKKIALP